MRNIFTIPAIFLLILFIISCQENNPDVLFSNPDPLSEIEDVNQFLADAATVVSGFINDDDVRDELLKYATPEHDGELEVAFSELYEKEANARSHSPFLSKLRKTISEIGETGRTEMDLETLERYLVEGNIGIRAPYYAEDFADSDEPITLTWWDGEDESGVTEGFISTNASNGRQPILVDDDYASTNPTMVLTPIGDPDSGGGSGGTGGTVDRTPRNIDCQDLKDEDILRLKMPQIRLTGNTRGWPSKNTIYMWIADGSITQNANGSINTSSTVNYVMSREISRKSGRNKTWVSSNASFIQSNWRKEKVELRFIAGHKKSGAKLKVKGEVKVSKDGEVSNSQTTEYEINEQDKTSLMFNVGFDRCSTLAFITSDNGFGIKEGYGVYRFDQLEFYLEPEVR